MYNFVCYASFCWSATKQRNHFGVFATPLLSNRLITFETSICSLASYAVMNDCWKQYPDERPNFSQLLEIMEQLILHEVDYFDFEKLDETKDYYAVQESKAEETGHSQNTFL